MFNGAGDWIAVGSAKLGQLLVWEWRRCAPDAFVGDRLAHGCSAMVATTHS